ncbi:MULTISPECIES: methylmalonyl-CoA epimerase [Arthrobacter]|jgi:methylmalonyl-CoA/ethylmalonyl-CoA epimerase|uniref:Methylmalonyl-CoA/ethylmalonyl-CoA epimerase n=1 Tax=Arthrobacter bambusae TaxID=1338426 RepID=A0AAW8D938_9MICC|nr:MULTISPECIES: methylmalonyl-CoA epimerase [Arthrobacter]MDP9904250.1 methylmalonyl-CoA/ethylmalonyl-CoA epimerase [Arthrobacter bambusae]MDQ0127754.1 methylmalonyl-CoA/ethylmalonyl-CoA epimerase [Arthrobacter bambusae]MDQ0179097.1 methylmalonyl-CoA/ethylmalonyl-CoA epimerase [Arthrobacter bambusae]
MKLIQVAQRAVDLDRASAFYSRLLGSAPSGRFDPPGLLFFDLDGVRLLLDRGAPSSLIYLDVPDLRLSVEDLRASGTKIVQEPQLVYSHVDGSLGPVGSDEWMAFIKDSEGNTVGLVGRQASGS